MNSDTQNAMILQYMREKPITPLEAFRKFGSLRLGARIFELRKDGHAIETEYVTKDGKTFARYHLKENA
jgi:hypothetical protein